MSYNSDIASYKTQIDNDISTQSLPNSIPPDVVGSGYTDLADLLAPYINAINNEAILSGSGVPSSLLGNNLDLYYRTQPTYFELYRKESGSWVLKLTVPFGVTLPDGPATLRTFISGTTASVTKGGWFISNAVYNKGTQTNFTVPAADATFYRTDLIYANTSNQVLYLTGTPSLTPVDPTVPVNSVAVDYVIVPSAASGFTPYLRFGSTTENNGIAVQNDTGALTYGGISIASGTTVNIGACTGYVVNNETTPGDPTLVFVNYAGETNKTVTTLGSGIATYVLLNSLGVIVFQNTVPTSAQRKSMIYLSKIGHPTGTITTAGDEVDFALSPLAQHRDLFQAINYINNGVTASAAGATLNFALSTGVITGDGINFVVDRTNPNTYTVAPQPTASFLPRTQTGAGGASISTVDVGNYDVAGVVTAIPGGGNTSTLRYIYYVPPLGLIVQYGQTTYANLTDATAAVGKETFTIYPSLVRNAILIGVLAARKGATALNNTSDARFFVADKFGQVGGSSAGITTATLQTAYGNSLPPQITTTTPLGAVQYKRGSAADTDNVFQVLNGAGTAALSVAGNGSIVSNGSVSASAGLARSNYFNPTLTATANNDALVGLDVNPTFTTGAFTGVSTISLRVNGSIAALVNNNSDIGSSASQFATIWGSTLRGQTNLTARWGAGSNFSFNNSTNEVGRIWNTTGNVTFQNGGTFTDAGYRLDVQGSLRASNTAMFSRTAATQPSSIRTFIKNPTVQINSGDDNEGSPAALGFLAYNLTDSLRRGSEIYLFSTRSTITQINANTYTPIQSGDSIGTIYFGGDDSVGLRNHGAAIGASATDTWSATSRGSKLSFVTVTNGTTSPQQRMAIFDNGDVGIGNGGSSTGFKLDVQGTFRATGVATLQAGAEALKVGTNTGNPDHAYMGFYARTASPTTQSGYIGYNGVGTGILSIVNSISNQAITLDSVGSGSVTQIKGSQVQLLPTALATQGWQGTFLAGSGEAQFILSANISSLANGAVIYGSGNRGVSQVTSGDKLLSIRSRGLDNTSVYRVGGRIDFVTTENYSSTAAGTKLDFYTMPNGTITPGLALTLDQDATMIANGKIRLKGYNVVATLPTGVVGDTAYVTDALTPTYLTTVVGGGSVKCPVFYDGTNWVCH